jgi:hypothetical protein
MGKRRGQAALEFLTTYGWAFMVLLVMIGALVYFNVLNTDTFMPEKCTFEPGILCTDTIALAINPPATPKDNLNFTLINSLGKAIKVEEVRVSCGSGVTCTCTDPDTCGLNPTTTEYWKSEDSANLVITATGLTSSKVKVSIEIKYRPSGEYFSKNSTGEAILSPIT